MGPMQPDPAQYELLTKLLSDLTSRVNISDAALTGNPVNPTMPETRKPGYVPSNVAKSSAAVWAPGSPADGMRVQDLARHRQASAMEAEIVRAAQALHAPMEAVPAHPPGNPLRPGIPNPTVPTGAARAWSTLNPLLLFIDLLTQAADLNTGENQQLANRSTQPATITPGERKGK